MRIQSKNSVSGDLNSQTSFKKLIDRLPAKNLSASEKKLILQAVQKNELSKQKKFLLMETYFDNKDKFSTKDFKNLFQTLFGLKSVKDYHQFSDFIDEVSDAAANVIAQDKASAVRQSRTNEFVRLIVNSLRTIASLDQKEMLETDLKDKITEKLLFLEGRNSLVFDDENLKKPENTSQDLLDHGFAFAFRTADYSNDEPVPKKMFKDLNETQKEQYRAIKKTVEGQIKKVWEDEIKPRIEFDSATPPDIWFKQRLNDRMSRLGEDVLRLNSKDIDQIRLITESSIKKLVQIKDEKMMADVLHTYESSIDNFFSYITRRDN